MMLDGVRPLTLIPSLPSNTAPQATSDANSNSSQPLRPAMMLYPSSPEIDVQPAVVAAQPAPFPLPPQPARKTPTVLVKSSRSTDDAAHVAAEGVAAQARPRSVSNSSATPTAPPPSSTSSHRRGSSSSSLSIAENRGLKPLTLNLGDVFDQKLPPPQITIAAPTLQQQPPLATLAAAEEYVSPPPLPHQLLLGQSRTTTSAVSDDDDASTTSGPGEQLTRSEVRKNAIKKRRKSKSSSASPSMAAAAAAAAAAANAQKLRPVSAARVVTDAKAREDALNRVVMAFRSELACDTEDEQALLSLTSDDPDAGEHHAQPQSASSPLPGSVMEGDDGKEAEAGLAELNLTPSRRAKASKKKK